LDVCFEIAMVVLVNRMVVVRRSVVLGSSPSAASVPGGLRPTLLFMPQRSCQWAKPARRAASASSRAAVDGENGMVKLMI
jgi:hypothetical protein